MSVKINSKGRAFAKSLIGMGRYDVASDWSFDASDGDALLGDPPDYDRYGKHFLAVDDEADAETKAHFKYPFAKKKGDESVVYRKGLTAIRQRAGQQNQTDIFEAAGVLVGLIDAAEEKKNEERAKRGDEPLRDLVVGEDLEIGPLTRQITIDPDKADPNSRSIPAVASTEYPVERWWAVEILDHKPESIRSERTSRGIPVVPRHWSEDPVGRFEEIDSSPERGMRGKVRFGRSARAEEYFLDAKDKIRSELSIYYEVFRYEHEGWLELENGEEKRLIPILRATDWGPINVAFTAMAADPKAHISDEIRSKEKRHRVPIHWRPGAQTRSLKEIHMGEKDAVGGATAISESRSTTPEPALNERSDRPGTVDVNEIRLSAAAEERKRISTIRSQAQKLGLAELGEHAVEKGLSIDEWRATAMENLSDSPKFTPAESSADIGLSQRDIKNFSVVRAVNAAIEDDWSKAPFEKECSDAVGKIMRSEPKGKFFIPPDVLFAPAFVGDGLRSVDDLANARRAYARDIEAGSGGGGGGEYLVATDLLMKSFIELLREQLLLESLGAITLNNLVGNVAIPRQSAGATTYWVDESGDLTEDTTTAFDQAAGTPHTVGAFVDVSRRLIKQVSVGVESLLRLAMTEDLSVESEAKYFNGSGASGQPEGILNISGVGAETFAALGAPSYLEILAMWADVAGAKALFGNLFWVTTAAVAANMMAEEKATNTAKFVWNEETNKVMSYPAFVRSTMPANNVLFGNARDVVIFRWGGVDVNVDTATLSKSGSVRIVTMLDTDVNVRHVGSFSVGSGGV